MNLLSIVLFTWITIQKCIIVQPSAQACRDGDVRLSGGSHYRVGYVEVCRNQQWGRVCDDGWDKRDSTVVCRQLGFSEEGAEVITDPQSMTTTGDYLFFALDDIGCNGTESNLLDCLPQHNCGMNRGAENAGVQCLRKGVRLEHGPNQESNNTLITVNGTQGDGEKALLFCSTDRRNCCNDELNLPGSWFLPNGSEISSTTNAQSLYITLGNQAMGLNISPEFELPSGIYHCEMMDRENITHHLYAGIYPEVEGNVNDVSVQYNRASQTITCTSIGGPATNVTWYKDDARINMASNEGGIYKHSQIITDTVSATYENRLRIFDKSSETAGTYTCEVRNPRGSRNESLYIQEIWSLELINSKSTGSNGRVVEVCIDDQWHKTSPTTRVASNTQSPQDISVMITADSTSVMITWSTGQSIPNDNKIISGYDLSCITSDSVLSDGQIHEVRVPNISTNGTTKIQVNGLLSGTAYECCVNAHIHTNTPIDLISSSCVATSTESEKVSSRSIDLASGLGAGLGLLLLALFVGSIFINIFLMKRLAKKDQGMKVKFSSTNQVFEEEDSEHDGTGENTVRSSERENYDVLHHNVGTSAQGPGVAPMGAYEVISNLPTRPSGNRSRDIEVLQMAMDDDASAYAKLGAEGVGEMNADEDAKVGVNENELRSPYSNIFEISPIASD